MFAPAPSRRVLAVPRLVAAWIALVAVLVAPLLIGWHRTEVVHVTCAAHGESVHAEAEGHGVEGSAAKASDDAAVGQGNGPVGDADHHEHCGMVSVVAARPPHPIALLTAVPASALLAPTLPTRTAIVAVALLRQAPKTSPPV